MLDRNRRIKPRPERFQASKEKFDVVITCEERVYDQVLEGMVIVKNVSYQVLEVIVKNGSMFKS